MRIIQQARIGILMVIILTVVVGLAYPLVITGLAQVIFPAQANGTLIRNASGNVIGSDLIGQEFTQPEYFHPRPSAAGGNGYDASGSTGSNLGPTNQTLISTVNDRATAYRAENGLADKFPVPADAVTASASGLDPHITPANAALQVARVAGARKMPEQQVRALVAAHTEGRTLGIFGEDRVNVLDLNLALDQAQGR